MLKSASRFTHLSDPVPGFTFAGYLPVAINFNIAIIIFRQLFTLSKNIIIFIENYIVLSIKNLIFILINPQTQITHL